MIKKILIIFIVLFFVLSGLVIFFYTQGFNHPSAKKHPIRGVDVSSYQGDIDWDILADQNIDFAFIKATEGSGSQDAYFSGNFENALKTHLKVGAYHFFSYDSPGATQAENFINTVPKIDGMLPPVIDIEFYGDKASNPPTREETESILNELLRRLEERYGQKPIIYTTGKSYDLYIKGGHYDHSIWIRDLLGEPSLPDRKWVFWQYNNRKRLKGYSGPEKCIDMNIFNGSKEDFLAFCDANHS